MHAYLMLLVVALAYGCAMPAFARTWTSVSGHTVDAEYAGRDGTFIILDRPDGGQIKIPLEKLSAGDQAFVQDIGDEATQTNPEETEPTEPAAPMADPDRPFGPVVFQPVRALSTDQLPGVTPSTPTETRYLGLQFGPEAKDVLYIVVDTVDPLALPDTIYLYVPDHPAYGTPRKISGKKGKHNDIRIMRFTKIRLATSFEELRAEYDIDIILGMETVDTVALAAEVQLKTGSTANKFLLGAFVNEGMLIGTGDIPILRTLHKPDLRAPVRTRTQQPTFTPTVRMGPFMVRPVGKKIKLRILNDTGRTAEKIEHEVSEEELLSQSGLGRKRQTTELEGKTDYQLTGWTDMGPIMGALECRETFTTRAARKK